MKFKNYIETESGIKDTSTSPGTAGQVLSSTVTGTSWIDQNTISSGSSEVVDIQVKNISSANGGVNLSKGDPVYIYGSVGASARLYVDLADADSTATNNLGDGKMPCVGLLDQDLAPNGEGTATVVGKLRNLITSPIDGATPNENDTVYVKSGGGLTLTKPTGSTNLIQNVGQVGRVSTSSDGNIVVAALLRSNDVPNLPTGKIWVGDGNTIVSDVVYLDETNERMGINTTSPSQTLQVNGGVLSTLGLYSDFAFASNRNWSIETNTFGAGNWGGIAIKTSTSNGLDPNTTRFGIDSSGNVGIGTTSPDYALHVDPTVKIGDRQGTDGSLILQSQQGPNITFTSTGDNLNISGTTGSSNGNTIRLADNIKLFEFNANIGGTIKVRRGNRGLMDTNFGGFVVEQQTTTSSNGKSTFLSTDSNGTILRSTSYGGAGTGGDIQFQFGGGDNTSEPAPATKMIIKNIGNVGIGTTSPQSILHVSDANPELILEDTSNPNKNKIQNTDGNMKYHADYDSQMGNSKHIFFIDNSEKLRINTSGDVGIGTTSPNSRLEVNGEIDANGGDGYKIEGRPWANWSSDLLTLGDWDGEGYATRIMGSNSSEVMRVTGTNVGIGTINPGYKLDVSGDAYIDENLNIETTISGTLTYGYGGVGAGHLVVGGNNFASFTPAVITLMNQDTTINAGQDLGVLQFGGKDDQTNAYANGQIICTTAVGAGSGNTGGGIFRFLLSGNTTGSGPTERMRITNTGNVGIGTTGPRTKLHVSGLTNDDDPSLGSSTAPFFVSNTATSYGLNVGVNNVGASWLQSQSNTSAIAYEMSLNPLGGNVGVGQINPSEKLEVNGSVKATASTDAYKGYIKQSVICVATEKQDGTDYFFIPYNTSATSASAQYYNRMVAAYDGRVKKVYIKNTSGTPSADTVNLKKHVNNTTDATVYSATVANAASAGMSAVYNFANNDFTFSEGDNFGVLYQTVNSGGGGRSMAGVTINIIVEYNIT